VLRLREEGALGAARGWLSALEDSTTAEPSSGTRVSRAAPPPSAAAKSQAPRGALEELHEEVCRLRRRHAEQQRRDRRTRLEEWHLCASRREAKQVLRNLALQERRLEESREAHTHAECYLGDTEAQLAQCRRDVERERAIIQRLNRDAVSMREACYLPARLKRESGFLVKIMDQAGGRLKTRKHMRSLEACKKLYDEVAAHAPAVLPLASRAKAEMEAEFARYLQLEEAHSRALHRLHMAVTRGLLQDKDRDGLSIGLP